jgi:hypothetical protein
MWRKYVIDFISVTKAKYKDTNTAYYEEKKRKLSLFLSTLYLYSYLQLTLA